jgi:hypothetical protein
VNRLAGTRDLPTSVREGNSTRTFIVNWQVSLKDDYESVTWRDRKRDAYDHGEAAKR